MQQKKPDEILGDMQSTWQNMMGSFPASMQSLMETQRKNIQALQEANKQAMQGWQALAQRQTEMVSEFLQNNSAMAGQSMAEGTTADKIAAQADLLKSVYERSFANSRELAELAANCTKEAAEVLQKRAIASMNEIKENASKE